MGEIYEPTVSSKQLDLFFHHESKQLLIEGYYLNEVERAPGWYTKSKLSDKHLMKHVVMGSVTMHSISETNQLPKGCLKKVAAEKKAMKISSSNSDYIIEEIIRREALEDPDYEKIEAEVAAGASRK